MTTRLKTWRIGTLLSCLLKRNKYFLIIVLLISTGLSAQNDTIQLKNNDVLVGEVKSLGKGVLVLKTSYSDKDFKIEFNEVKGLTIQKKCLVILTDGRRRFGNIRTNTEGIVIVTLEDNTIEVFDVEEVIALKEVDDKFWSRITGSIDFGFNFTKANNTSQLTVNGTLDYIDRLWMFEGNVSVQSSLQDDAAKTKRTDASVDLIRILSRKWYILGGASFLSNTEQALEGRINPSLGFGRFLISSNKLYLGLSLGLTYNIEDYVDTSLNKTSTEAVVAANFNMFDFEDIDLNTSLDFYKSLSEKSRYRSDYDITLKYDLPLDLYIKMGFTLNYDNQPAIEGNDFDYVFSSGFGWKLD
jgi:putative salt-induced outer membrane protein YdiY